MNWAWSALLGQALGQFLKRTGNSDASIVIRGQVLPVQVTGNAVRGKVRRSMACISVVLIN